MKKSVRLPSVLMVVCSFFMVAAAPMPPQPEVNITLLNELPANMTVGKTYTVEIQLESDIPFNSAMAMPDMYYPGRFVVAHGVSRSGRGTSATLYITFTAKSTTEDLPGEVAPVAVVAGARYKQGVSVAERFDFNVTVTP